MLGCFIFKILIYAKFFFNQYFGIIFSNALVPPDIIFPAFIYNEVVARLSCPATACISVKGTSKDVKWVSVVCRKSCGENEYGLEVIAQYEEKLKNGQVKFFSHNEVKKKFGLCK